MTAIIPISDRYRIELTTHSWQVCKWRNRNNHPDGGAFEGESWHKSLQRAGEWLVERLLAEDDLDGIQEIVEALHAASRLIAYAIKESPYPDSWIENRNRTGNQQ